MAASFKLLDDPIRQSLGRFLSGIESELRRLGRFIWLIDTGEVLDLAGQRSLVQALRIAGDNRFQRRLNEDLQELAFRRSVTSQPSFGSEWRDERAEHDEAGVCHQPRHFADAPNVLDPIGGGEAQILVEAVTNVVAVEQRGVHAPRVKLGLNQIGDCRLPRA